MTGNVPFAWKTQVLSLSRGRGYAQKLLYAQWYRYFHNEARRPKWRGLYLHPSKIKRYLYSLSTYNFIRITGGNRFKTGFEYEVIATDEYRSLENAVNTVLDNVLEEIKQKVSGSGGLQVVHGQNRPLNSKNDSKIIAVVQ